MNWKYVNLGSELGLGREASTWIGKILMLFGFFLATPPGMVTPDDFLNIMVADFLSATTGIGFHVALALAYTFIAYGVFLLGAMIYPYNTGRLVYGFFHKIKRAVVYCFRNPIIFAVSIGIIWFIYSLYLSDFATIYA